MPSKSFTAFAPATVANVGPGFDILGFSLEGPGDEVTASWSNNEELSIISIDGDGGKLSTEVDKNCIGVVAKAIKFAANCDHGISLKLKKSLPLGSGMGSSAASSAASALAVNALLGYPFTTKELVQFAMIGELHACGAAHADNVAPALLRGFSLISSYEPLRIFELPTPSSLYYAVVNPDFILETSHARSVLPREISLSTGTKQSAALATFIHGLYTDDNEAIASALVDYIAEPVRFPLIPFSDNVKKAALKAGALNCNISGSGPSLFSLSSSRSAAELVAKEMVATFSESGLRATSHVGKIQKVEPRIFEN